MKTILLAFILSSLCLACNAQTDNQEIVKQGDVMPPFMIVNDDGDQISSATLKGKVVLINFFATWCPPCQQELAAVQERLWTKYKDNPSFQLLVIGREHTDADLATYNQKKGFTFPLYPDQKRIIFDTFAKSLIPRSYLIDKNGKVISVTIGYTAEEFEILLANIDSALK